MKIIDMHVHAWGTEPQPDKLIDSMEKAGVWGACVMSSQPMESNAKIGLSFEARMEEVFAWQKGYEDRIFPILWIHPKEENLCSKIQAAVQKGICGFKMICKDYYVYSEETMEILRTIADLNVPVFFHSGILWDGTDSSKYNRPVHWEVLSKIPGLRFSLGHCSWPWIDECFAVYGQFLNAQTHGNPAEMFFDTTPGTPAIYRKDLLSKLFSGGYDTGYNVMFGSDCFAYDYKLQWAAQWLKTDQAMMQELGVSRKIFENYYYHNVMRFLGKGEAVTHELPVPDNAGGWSPKNPEVPKIIEKWYQKLGFPRCFDEEFYRILKDAAISDTISADAYDVECQDGKRNFLSALFLCETLEKKYQEKGIGEPILFDTLSDIVTYTNIFSDLKNELSLGRMEWILKLLDGKIFRLGRLQFGLEVSLWEIPEKGIKKGDTLLRCYIPFGGKLSKKACEDAFFQAKNFFGKEYPIVVKSWLLDDGLQDILPPDSNILSFRNLFEVVDTEESDAILRYVFRWNTNRFSVKFVPAYNCFSEAVKQAALAGKTFREGIGFLR
ncbi:MAG: amidohydrolase family protein [Clostridia bacterium]|nr:amidohydrolase family protein [Clostridia bacterium]